MDKDKARLEAMKAIATVRELDVQAERAIKGYIDFLEGLLNQKASTGFDKLKEEFADMESEVKRLRNSMKRD